jgi:hypothetical protein
MSRAQEKSKDSFKGRGFVFRGFFVYRSYFAFVLRLKSMDSKGLFSVFYTPFTWSCHAFFACFDQGSTACLTSDCSRRRPKAPSFVFRIESSLHPLVLVEVLLLLLLLCVLAILKPSDGQSKPSVNPLKLLQIL